MEVKKNPDLVDAMFAGGEVSRVDPESKYRYSFLAFCPKDGEYSYVNRYDTSGRAIENVTFKCATCSTLFKVPISQIFLI